MSAPLIKTNFTIGEVAPALFGHVDLARYSNAASTARNCFVSYQGGLYSRPGTAFCGFSKQTGRAYPPRMIDFQFSINQGLALEFGNQYMRVVSDGAFVTTDALVVTAVSQSKPALVTVAGTTGEAATAINTGVTSSYAPGEQVTLAGGTFTSPAVLGVVSTTLLSAILSSPGAGYAPGNTIAPSGGTQTTAASLTVSATQVSAASVASAGSGGTGGSIVTVTGTTGTGTKFTASVTLASGGGIGSVNSITFGGLYTVNPSNIAAEPVTGGGVTGATLNLSMGVGNITLTSGGVFTANPSGGVMGQQSTSGAGSGVVFSSCLFGPAVLDIVTAGNYSILPVNPVSQASTTGSGAGAVFDLTSAGSANFSNGDWVFINDVSGMTELNGNTYVVGNANGAQFSLYDVYGNAIDSSAFTAYLAGGTASLIFTMATPWGEEDLRYMKFTQSADVMSICCVNQKTLTEYPPYDLSRISDTDWTLTQVVAEPTVSPPPGTPTVSVTAPPSGTNNYQEQCYYSYVVTAVNPNDGTESVASASGNKGPALDIAEVLGQVTVIWNPVPGVNQYNVYKATPGYLSAPPAGSLYGYAGTAYGTSYIDANIVADFTQVPPTHQDPFAPGQILGATPVTGGGGYTLITFTINSATGSGAVLVPVIQGGALVAILVQDAGRDYEPGDTVTVSGNGSGASATLDVGPQTGTYPSLPSYFQERRVYANTLNNPDTYWMSQPGAFTNFDSRIPTIASDAITGSPWSVEVNGIQWMINMPGGIVVLTGLNAWQLTGQGGSSLSPQPISPSTQQAQPQEFNGASATVPPIQIDFDIIYLQAKGAKYRDLSYQIITNIYTGTDITINSSHLFNGYTILENCWCQEPFYNVWAVRSDGVLLSLCYVKPEQIMGWARHDSQGLFQSVCSVTEPPVDALYCAVQRQIGTNTAYTVERMDNRLWPTTEDVWAVDCGLSLPQPTPAATLTASSATGAGAITGFTGLVGGTGYSAGTTCTVVDDNGQGPGTGCEVSLTIVGGVITDMAFPDEGQNYTYPSFVFNDPAGSEGGRGASATPVLTNTANFIASAAVFTNANVGNVIRMGGGIAVITAYVSAVEVQANITNPIAAIQQGTGLPQPQPAGNWTMTAPVTKISGLEYLSGATVTGLADGVVVPPTVVAADGSIVLAEAASAVTLGLGFTAQAQSVYLDAGNPTIQGQRKKVAAATARVQSSSLLQMGANQPDGSTLSPQQISPAWNGMDDVPDVSGYTNNAARRPYNSKFQPLVTGDLRIPTKGGFNKPGQVAIQQTNPLPMEILAFMPEILPGDTPQTQVPQQPPPQQQRRPMGRAA